jgi:hypothetical protein
MRGIQTLRLLPLLNTGISDTGIELYGAHNYGSLYVTARFYKADCVYSVSTVTVTRHSVIKLVPKLLHRCILRNKEK